MKTWRARQELQAEQGAQQKQELRRMLHPSPQV